MRVHVSLLVLAASLLSACPQPPQTTCGPSTCQGCCDAVGACVAGLTTDQCGARGNACSVCQGGAACVLGSCAIAPQGGGNAAGGMAGGDAGGSVAGGSAGGSAAGGSAAGGSVAGGSVAGGSTAGGSAAGGAAAGGSAAGGAAAGGDAAGGAAAGGSVAGGSAAGGSAAGGSAAGGSAAGGSAGGNGECAGSTVLCSGTCRDVLSDENNCGVCGRLCGSGQVCNLGQCQPLPTDCVTGGGCAPGFSCDPVARTCSAGCRINSECPTGATCGSNGQCTCPAGEHACGQACVSNAAVTSCGATSCRTCPAVANAAPVCSSSTSCDFACNGGFLRCGNACAPCTTPANASPVCNGAACDFACDPGFHRCGSQCLPDTSVNSCGTSCTPCPTTAGGTTTCTGGQCGITCDLADAGVRLCSGVCASCTTPANASPVCSGTACDFACNFGFHRCGSQCQPDNSVNTCGPSCSPCPTDPNGTATCTQASGVGPFSCGLSCNPGSRLCGGTCAPCGPTPANATQVCSGTTCSFQCNSPWASDGTRCVRWQQASATGPGARTSPTIAFDSARNLTVLAGGSSGVGSALSWEWNGTSWAQVSLIPATRVRHAMVWDSVRQRLVLFGGIESGTLRLNTTWERNGTVWGAVTPMASPPARSSHAMAYDAARQRVVLFGGYNGTVDLSDTWLYDGTTWTNPAVTGPSGRSLHGMAYDPVRQRVVLFGGFDGVANLRDTWEWDGATWTQRTSAVNPPAVEQSVMAWDSNRQRVSLFARGEVWDWNGTAWQRIPLASTVLAGTPGPRINSALTFDPVRSKLVLFGGSYADGGTAPDDTWTMGP